jgi:hypothetical protein
MLAVDGTHPSPAIRSAHAYQTGFILVASCSKELSTRFYRAFEMAYADAFNFWLDVKLPIRGHRHPFPEMYDAALGLTARMWHVKRTQLFPLIDKRHERFGIFDKIKYEPDPSLTPIPSRNVANNGYSTK